MANQVKVSVPKMKNDREQLQTEFQEIPAFVRELDAAMKQLGTCWEGPAWITFQQQLESDIVNMLDLYDWLREYLQELSKAEKIYGDSEKKSYDCVDSVKV